MRPPSWLLFGLLLLAGIGVFSQLSSDPAILIVPLAIVAVVYIVYKLGPKRGAAKPRIKKSAKTEAKVKAMKNGVYHPPRKMERRRSSADLRVIEGNKSKTKHKS